MPINKALYHPRWDLISRWIRFHRAKGRCEGCGVKNYSAGHWMGDNWFTRAEFDTYKEAAEYRTIYNQFQVTNDTPRVKSDHFDHGPPGSRSAQQSLQQPEGILPAVPLQPRPPGQRPAYEVRKKYLAANDPCSILPKPNIIPYRLPISKPIAKFYFLKGVN
jgi:hypothetical protein